MANNDDLRRYLSVMSEDLSAQKRMLARAVETINNRLHVGSPGYYSDDVSEENVYVFDGDISDEMGISHYRWRIAGRDAPSYEHIFDIYWTPEKPFILSWAVGKLITKKPMDLYKLSSAPTQLSGYKEITLPVETTVAYFDQGKARIINIDHLIDELMANGDL